MNLLINHQTHAKASENKMPSPLASNEIDVAILELRINAIRPATTMNATNTRRIVMVVSGFLIMSLCGTSRIEAKHKTRAKAPAIPIAIFDAIFPSKYHVDHLRPISVVSGQVGADYGGGCGLPIRQAAS